MRLICWFSCGAASAVATKLAITENAGKLPVVIARCIVREEHPDNDRFAADCEKWFGMPITNLIHEKYDGSIYRVIQSRKYISGVAGAPCTMLLKKEVRLKFELPTDRHVFGYCAEEQERYDSFLDANNIDCIAPLIDKGLSHSNALAMIERAGIELPDMYKLGYQHNNCFSGNTEFITDQGVKTLRDEVGKTVSVLTRQGWKDADVLSFGTQPLMKIDLSIGVRRKTIFATPDHRWYVPKYVNASQGVVEKTTRQLEIGDRPLVSYLPPEGLEFDRIGFQHGFTFGDGTLYGEMYSDSYANNYARAYFADGKKEAVKYFDKTPTGDCINGLPAYFKELPNPGNAAYTLGFLAGLVASDGCVSKSGLTISNKSASTMQAIANLCASIGILAYAKPEMVRSTNYKQDATLTELVIPKDSFRQGWLVRECHKERFGSKRTKAKSWRIDSITPAQSEEVFCVTVKGGPPEFTLEGNILTGNCIGCVKATGAGYWNKIRKDFPMQFWRMAGASRALGARMVRVAGERVFLDELPEGIGRYQDEPEIQCGIFCEMANTELEAA